MVVKKKIFLGRVMKQDKDFVILEIARSDDTKLQISGGERFYTLIFCEVTPWGDSGNDE